MPNLISNRGSFTLDGRTVYEEFRRMIRQHARNPNYPLYEVLTIANMAITNELGSAFLVRAPQMIEPEPAPVEEAVDVRDE